MHIIFASLKSERSPEYQIMTCIFKKNGQLYAEKKALTPEALAHIQNLIKNYKLFEREIITDKNTSLCEIIDSNENAVLFKYITGNTFELLLCQAIQKRDKSLFLQIISDFWNFLHTTFKLKSFNMSEDFRNLFGDLNYTNLEGESAFESVSNIDLNLDNIILNEGKYIIIDGEWIYPFSIPLNFIFFRAISMFYLKYPDAELIITIEELLENYKIREFQNLFKEMEKNFQTKILSGNYFGRYLKDCISWTQIEKDLERSKLLKAENEALKSELNLIHSSISWRTISKLFKLINKLLPLKKTHYLQWVKGNKGNDKRKS